MRTEFFVEKGLLGMLEAPDRESLDHISLFLVAVIDCCGKESEKAPITKFFVSYSKPLAFYIWENHSAVLFSARSGKPCILYNRL